MEIARKNRGKYFFNQQTRSGSEESLGDIMAGRNTQISRIYMILNILEGAPQGLSAAQITERLNDRFFDVSKRTVYRDLEALRAAGFSLSETGSTDDNGTKWTLDRNLKMGLVFHPRELIALYLSRNILACLNETPLSDDLNSLFSKIEEKIDSKKQAFLKELEKEIYVEQGNYWGLGIDADILDTIRAACSERHKIEMVYNSVHSRSVRKRMVGPHYLYIAKRSVYLVAEDLEEKSVKVFSVSRISTATMTDEVYEGTIIDPERFFTSSFGIFRASEKVGIKLLFNDHMSAYIRERKWHESQQVVQRSDGRMELTFEAGITPELIAWIQSFGPDVTPLEPQQLIDRLCERAEKTLAHYRTWAKKVG
jgi:proteasome accessory factor B